MQPWWAEETAFTNIKKSYFLQFFQLLTQLKNASSLAKWSTAFKISQTHVKSKHLSYVANTFAIILYCWIYHIHTLTQILKLFFHELLCTFLYKTESNWQRNAEKFTVNTKARLKPNFFTVSICGCEYSITVWKKSMCSCVDVCL